MKANEIREAFLKYFNKNGHTIVQSAPLLPKGDPTLLFTNAGMVQFKGVFLGEEKRDFSRAVSVQKCMRAGGKHNDLENVGRTARHHTFFEMLGNFSFGDYFKKEAVAFAWDFMTKEMGLDSERLWATVFQEDDEAAGIWEKTIGIPKNRIVRMGEKDNFWAMGDVGPCGPCSEIIIDQGKEIGCGRPDCAIGCDCDRFLELWNLVFMQYSKDLKGKLTPLPKPSIDTGMGLERLTAVIQGKKSNYESDLFMPLINFIEDLSEKSYGEAETYDISIRAIADHSRAVTFLITDGVLPSNEGRGYVLRRILRRASRHGKFIGINEPFLYKVCGKVIEIMGGIYPEIVIARDSIIKAAEGEETRFLETLERGLNMLEEEIGILKQRDKKTIPGDIAFKLYDTYGFPLDLTADIIRTEGLSVDEQGFNLAMEEQRLKAREAWKGSGEVKTHELYNKLSKDGIKVNFVGYHADVASSKIVCLIKDGKMIDNASQSNHVEVITKETPFYGESGGQAGDIGSLVGKGFELTVVDTKKPLPDIIVHHCTVKEGKVKTGDNVELVPDLNVRRATSRHHTATHLLHASLRNILGEHIRQAGSLVGPTRLRFDFNHFASIPEKELNDIEYLINEKIMENLSVTIDTLPYKDAVNRGALAFFDEKYGDTVRMVAVEGFSKELCGGIHVKKTGDIGLFKIISDSSVAAGIRRIEAVAGAVALKTIAEEENNLREAASLLKVSLKELPDKISKLIQQQKAFEKEIESLKAKLQSSEALDVLKNIKTIGGVNVLSSQVEATNPDELRQMADVLRAKINSGVVVLGSRSDGKAFILAAITQDLSNKFNASNIIKELAPLIGGKGGGKTDMAQAGGNNPAGLKDAMEKTYKIVETTLTK
ncbi:MAG: alanine--tRNA ligase [Deltaproteobacteria bacterium RIFCSPLOWO2_12_FULL_43_16]|nr:MAG: alanine--tRNA ligase [Deltaproteobacteria bacterium GWA2_43_19]OGQ12431.1 MAG: alanine--tRNA ligase [Deltaproteobacteria bacterium RIFCSPHIGHO2_02_FULL_43_33]OGQ59404.1 MAG: alanine--tRNA ligase [Deltaproteobacteria bacterium RIFCSPLOWO2_12_FULL_43_16]HBR17824.1 alanine--tRNA ligase [Deltaproteobacteria bacterium]